MRQIKYIVPPGLEDIKVEQSIIDNVINILLNESKVRDRIVFLGRNNGCLCFSLCGGELPRYANSPAFLTVDDAGRTEWLSGMKSMSIIDKAIKDGVDEALLLL